MLILSAILKENLIYLGKRHSDIFSTYNNINLRGGIQGFIDKRGFFYDRKEAATYAFKEGQIKEEKEILFSEDLW